MCVYFLRKAFLWNPGYHPLTLPKASNIGESPVRHRREEPDDRGRQMPGLDDVEGVLLS